MLLLFLSILHNLERKVTVPSPIGFSSTRVAANDHFNCWLICLVHKMSRSCGKKCWSMYPKPKMMSSNVLFVYSSNCRTWNEKKVRSSNQTYFFPLVLRRITLGIMPIAVLVSLGQKCPYVDKRVELDVTSWLDLTDSPRTRNVSNLSLTRLPHPMAFPALVYFKWEIKWTSCCI